MTSSMQAASLDSLSTLLAWSVSSLAFGGGHLSAFVAEPPPVSSEPASADSPPPDCGLGLLWARVTMLSTCVSRVQEKCERLYNDN